MSLHPTEARTLSPTALIRMSLNEFGGLGIIQKQDLIVKGGALFSNLPQRGEKLRFLVQITPIEWIGMEESISYPPLSPQECDIHVSNGWLRFDIPRWGRLMLLPGDSDLQRLLHSVRTERVKHLRTTMSRTVNFRHIILSFEQEY